MIDAGDRTVGVAVVGLGQIGATHARIVASLPSLSLEAVTDIDADRTSASAANAALAGRRTIERRSPTRRWTW